MMIYLASPYSHPDGDVVVRRFDAVCRVAAEMMAGSVQVFCPIAHTHPIAVVGQLPTGWEFWNEFDRWFIERCDKVVVLMLPGWEHSRGVAAEIAIAQELGIPVEYIPEDGGDYAGSQAD